MNARITKAIAACTRTLTGSPDADALVSRAGAATVSGLRAFADRVAVQRRFHNPAIHQQHVPGDGHALELFEAIEQARLDALGVCWLPGIARNLLAHPGADEDGIRWMAFEAVSGRAAPPEKAALTAAVRERLPARLADELKDMAAQGGDQRAVAGAPGGAGRRPGASGR